MINEIKSIELFASILFISHIDAKGGSLPKKPIPTLTRRTVSCLLFDLGDTLWFRKDLAVWQQLENASNAQAAELLRQTVASMFTLDRTCIVLFQAEDGIRDYKVTGVQTCALPISSPSQWVSEGAGGGTRTRKDFRPEMCVRSQRLPVSPHQHAAANPAIPKAMTMTRDQIGRASCRGRG